MKAVAYILAVSAMAYIVSGCGDPDKPVPPPQLRVTTDNFCRIMKSYRIDWSVRDTSESIDLLRSLAHVKTCACARTKPKACKSNASAST